MQHNILQIKPKFGFGTLVHTILDSKKEKKLFKVLSLQINIDSTIAYGCVDEEGEWSWYKEYEIMAFEPDETNLGFGIYLDF